MVPTSPRDHQRQVCHRQVRRNPVNELVSPLNLLYDSTQPTAHSKDTERIMHNHHRLKPMAAIFMAILLSTTIAYAKSNPLKPNMTKSPSSLSSPTADFMCGTYKGNQNESIELYHRYQSVLDKVAPAASTAFINDDVWIIEDDGTLTFSGNNPFDTDGQTFRFTPNANGSYDVTTVTFSFDAILGTNLNLGDDNNAIISLAFTFNYFDVGWTSVNVNANGIVAFGGNVNPSGFFDNNDFFGTLPKLALYFMDLNPAAGGGVFWKSEATKSTITWNSVPEFGTSNTNRFQLVLHDDGSFDLTFNGITSTIPVNGLPTTFGAHPGGDPSLDIISFSDDLPFSGGPQAGFYEQYLNLVNPRVNEVALIQRFYQNFSDDFFQIIFFTNFVQTMSGFANELNIKNDVQGIGLSIFDNSSLWGSNGILESRCNMNRLAAWPTDPTLRFFGSENNFLTIMGQEAGHRWGAFINFRDSTGSVSNLILGRANAHWSYFVDVDHSSLEGGNWEPLSGSIFTTPTMIDYFGDIDEYIFGVRTLQEVTPTFYVSSPTNDLPENRDNGTPIQGATATGVPVEVTIDDIISAEGPRIPAEADEDKDLRQAFVLLLQNGTTATQAELDKIADFRRTWEDYFEVALDGRITCNTKLTQTLPVAVIEGHVLEGGTRLPLDSVKVEALERGFTQFVPSGARYTFRFMPDSPPPPDSCCATIAVDAPGRRPDTLVVCIPYGTVTTLDIELWPVASGLAQGQTPSLAPRLSLLSYPNPFNPQTTLTFVVPTAAAVRLAIYDVRGRLVRTLVNKKDNPGEHTVTWDGRDEGGVQVGSGVYLARLQAGKDMQTRKIVLLK